MEEQGPLAFEEALAKLEAIVAEMEGGRLTLEQSMARFEEGMKLTTHCGKQLGETEKKIEILLKSAQGTPKWQETSADDDGEKGSGEEGIPF